MTSVFLKKFKRNRFLLVLLLISTLFYSCLGTIGNIDEAEDSGYVLNIKNFSETSYVGFTFYSGVINDKANFVALDSIVYSNILIPSKDDGNYIREDGKKFSLVEPFQISKNKLTRFNTWAPPSFEKINEIRSDAKVSLQFYLHKTKKSVIRTPNGIGNIFFNILEDGTLQ